MRKIVGALAATLFVATSAWAIPAKPADLIQTFVKSDALQELLADKDAYNSITISLAHKLTDAVETLCNQRSRSRSIVSVTLGKESGSNVYYFQTPFSPSDLKRCVSGSDGL